MFGWNALFRTLVGGGPVDILPWVLGMSGVTVAFCAVAWRGPWRPSEPQFAAQFGALMLTALLVSPHLYRHEMLVVFLPALLLSSSLPRGLGRQLGTLAVVGTWALLAWTYQLLEMTGLNLTTAFVAALLLGSVAAAVGTGRSAPQVHGHPVAEMLSGR